MGDHYPSVSQACQCRSSAGETETPYNRESSNSHSKRRPTSYHMFFWPARTKGKGKFNVHDLSLGS